MATYKEFEKFVKSEFGAIAPEDAPAGFMGLEVPLGNRSQIVFFTKSGNDKIGENARVISFVGNRWASDC